MTSTIAIVPFGEVPPNIEHGDSHSTGRRMSAPGLSAIR